MFVYLQRRLYRLRTALLKIVVALIPQPKPLMLLGPDSSLRLCQTIAEFGVGNVLLVTDKPLVELGMIEPLRAELKNSGVESVLFDGVEPDPTDIIVHAGIAEARKSGCDGVLAVGGGSSIDAAKVISLGVNSDKDPLQHKGVISKPGVPLFAIPTTAGTGSEVSVAAVITDSKTQSKKGLGGPGVAPVATALDPILMQKLPPHITAATGMDALTHAIEAYVGIAGTHDTDRYALASARLIFENLPRAYQQGDDLKARQAMAIGASYGGFAINKAMVGYAHAIAHQLGAKYHVPHGLANAVLLPHVMAFSQQAAEQRMAEMARFAGLGSKTESDATLAQTLTDKVIELNKLLGIPEQLEQIKKEDYPQLIRAALKEGAGYPVPNFMTAAECEQILRAISVS